MEATGRTTAFASPPARMRNASRKLVARLRERSPYDNETGTALVEFAILLPLLLVILFGMLDIGRAEALRFAAQPLSLSEPLREDGDAELGDVVEDRSAESPFEVAATVLLPEEISRLLSPLDERVARDPQAPLRPGPGRASHPRRGRRALQPHP